MKTLKFYGASDDLFEVKGSGKGEPYEIGCYDGTAAVSIIAPDGSGLVVGGFYNMPKWPHKGACWAIAVSLLDEDKGLPAWPMRFETNENGYSPMLIIDAPDGVSVQKLGEKHE